MREFLEQLEKDEQLIHVKKTVSPQFEIPTLLKNMDGKPVIFEKVEGTDYRVVGNVVSSREFLAKALGVPPAKLMETIVSAIASSKSIELIDSPPCQQVTEEPALERFQF